MALLALTGGRLKTSGSNAVSQTATNLSEEDSEFQKSTVRLLRIFLATALSFAFFAPPLAVGIKKIFPYDLILFAWPLVGLVHLGPKKVLQHLKTKTGLWTFIMVLALTVAFLHGRYRVDVRALLEAVENKAADNEAFGPFSWMQDGILYLRFVSWTLAVTTTLVMAKVGGKLSRSAAVSFAQLWGQFGVIEAVIATLGYFTFLRRPLGTLYGYDPDYLYWSFQFHGTQSSPMECALLLTPALLWYALQWKEKRDQRLLLPLAVLTFGLLGTKSLTISFALVAAWFVLWNRQFLLKHLRLLLILSILIVAAALYLTDFSPEFRYARENSPTLFYLWNVIGAQGKMAHLVFRFQPWLIFLKTVFSRLDFALFGLGFARSHSDNGYIQILRAGGILLLGLYSTLVVRLFRTLRKTTNLPIQDDYGVYHQWCLGITFMLFISAFTTDSLIYRAGGTGIMLAAALAVETKDFYAKRL